MKRILTILSISLLLGLLLAGCAQPTPAADTEAQARIDELEAQLAEAQEGAVSQEELDALQAELDAARAEAEAAIQALELDEAARMDGASTLRIYWSIFLPQAKPVLASVTILTFISRWKDYFGPLLYLNTSDKYPIALGIQYFRGFADYATQWHLLMAAGVILSIPPFVIFLIFQRYFVEGMALTGIKG